MADAFLQPSRFSEAEWHARVQLAAAYRIFAHLGWAELIYNHISLRVPGPDAQRREWLCVCRNSEHELHRLGMGPADPKRRRLVRDGTRDKQQVRRMFGRRHVEPAVRRRHFAGELAVIAPERDRGASNRRTRTVSHNTSQLCVQRARRQ